MTAAAEMIPDWSQWEGEMVSGEFRLEQFLGAGEKSAVFRTPLVSGNGAIKLVAAAGARAERLVEQWSRAAALDHPHVVRVLKVGTWSKAGNSFVYVVTEYAEESLAGVLAQRALTAEETLEMLRPAAEALAFLHDRGFAHGSLKPSNVLAVKDTLKISTDTVSAGDTSADLRAFAAIIVQALTQQPVTFLSGAEAGLMESLAEPFREIARNCNGDSGRPQWSATEISHWLRSRNDEAAVASIAAASASRPKARSKLVSYAIVLALIAVVVTTIVSLLRNRTTAPVLATPASAAKPKEQARRAGPPASAHPEEQPAPAPIKPSVPAHESQPRRVVVDTPGQVVHQVLPEIPYKARQTIRGRAKVVVRVTVDQSGKVTGTTLDPGGSRYFGRLALDAARKWRFVPAGSDAPREWTLRFEITRTGTRTFPRQVVAAR